MVEELENKIKKLFESEGIGKCADRFLSTIKAVSCTQEDYIAELKLRLKQGGVE